MLASLLLAPLLLVGAVVFVGLGTGVAASTVSTAGPVGSTSAVDDVQDSKPDTSTRRRAARSATTPSTFSRGAEPGSGRSVLVERLLVRVLRLGPPSWRGPPVLLI